MQLPRVYPICDTAALAARGGDPVAFAHALIDGGATLLQFRHKGEWRRETVQALAQVSEAAARAHCQLVVNDRADLARVFDAGIHVGQHDLAPADARRVAGPAALLGFSTHNEEQLLAAEAAPADYLAFGPVFPTRSKQNPDPVVGLDTLRRLRPLTARPLVAIGGITRETAGLALEAGADAVAVIAGLMPDEITPDRVRDRMKAWLEATR
jgi:thiamine-phosphate pyrophosphorylase